MRRPWEKFDVVAHSVEVEYIDVVRRSRGVLVAEIGTRQKYPEVLAWTGCELHLMTSQRTPKFQRNESPDATSVMFPRSVRGWSVVAPGMGRYSLTIVLYKPARIRLWHRDRRNKMTARTEEWRVEQMLKN